LLAATLPSQAFAQFGWQWQNPLSQGHSLYEVEFINADYGWAVGAHGGTTWVAQSGVTFIGEERIGEVPTDYALEQNYPNPFNPSTKISFKLRVSGFTSLKVYDELGREVRTIVSEELKAGSYEPTFDGTGFSSGVYFCQLKARDFVATRRLLLLR